MGPTLSVNLSNAHSAWRIRPSNQARAEAGCQSRVRNRRQQPYPRGTIMRRWPHQRLWRHNDRVRHLVQSARMAGPGLCRPRRYKSARLVFHPAPTYGPVRRKVSLGAWPAG